MDLSGYIKYIVSMIIYLTVCGAAFAQTGNWPNTVILVHGYAGSSNAQQGAARGIIDNPGTISHYDNFWYWTGTLSDGRRWAQS